WLRQTTCDRLALASRHHLGAECRDVSREVPLLDHSSLLLAGGLRAVTGDTPLSKLMAQEQAQPSGERWGDWQSRTRRSFCCATWKECQTRRRPRRWVSSRRRPASATPVPCCGWKRCCGRCSPGDRRPDPPGRRSATTSFFTFPAFPVLG